MLDFVYDKDVNDKIINTEETCHSERKNSQRLNSTICRSNDVIVEYRSTDGGPVVFQGVSKGTEFIDRMTIDLNESTYRMLINAINNRTRERNYFRLYSELKDEIITEDEFEQRIEAAEDDFVVSSDITPSKNDIKKALYLSKVIKDVETLEDLSLLFSFDSEKTTEILKELDYDANILCNR